jgi:hypothetical protein
MKTLAELQDPAVLEAFTKEAIDLTRQAAGNATAEKGFGKNYGVLGRDGEASQNVDAWFENAAWS